jgi:hypothetical protein
MVQPRGRDPGLCGADALSIGLGAFHSPASATIDMEGYELAKNPQPLVVSSTRAYGILSHRAANGTRTLAPELLR